MSVMQKVVDYAKSQIGYLSTIKGDKKYQKYGEDIDTNHVGWYNGKKNGWDWCTQFVDDSYIQTYGEPAARILLNRPKGADLGAVVKYQYNYMKQAGQVGTTPRVGAIVYFQNSKGLCHVGIVVGVEGNKVITVEGNTSYQGHNGVNTHSYTIGTSYIYGYGYPDYDAVNPRDYTVGDTYKVLVGELNIRDSIDGKVIGQLNRYDKIKCIATDKDKNGNIWMRGEKGWSAAYYNGEVYIGDYGWMKKGDKWYYYNADGDMLTNSFVRYKGEKYYMGADGAMVTGWQTISGAEYYFYEEGHMARGEWIAKGKEYYFLNMDGTRTYQYIGSWKKDDDGYWFEDTSGWYAKDRTVRIQGKAYAFDENGYLVD